MQASKQFYKSFPDTEKPQKRIKKQKQNVDSISYLKSKFTHEQIINMLQKESEPDIYKVDYRKGKVIKRRQPKQVK